MLRIAMVAVCLSLVCGASVKQNTAKKQSDPSWEKPPFCLENDCPVYELLEDFGDYERRRYPSATWVSTTYEASSLEEADEMSSVAFNKLFNYIDGQNDRGEVL